MLKYNTAITFALIILLISCSGDSPPKLARLNTDAKILAFGDSLTYGTGASRDQSYPAHLQQLIKRTVINAGVPGDTTQSGLRRFDETLSKHNPDLLILCLGGNDFLRKVKTEESIKNLRLMLSSATKKRLPVILIAVPRIGLPIALSPAEFYETLAEDFKLPLELNTLSELESKKAFKSDQIHLNASGYRALAEAVAELMRKTGAI